MKPRRKKTIKQEFKLDLYPTKEQIEMIKINVNNVCRLWDYFIDISNNHFSKYQKHMFNKELRTHIKNLPVNQTYSQTLQHVATDFERQLRLDKSIPEEKNPHKIVAIEYHKSYKINNDFIYIPKIGWIIYDGAIHKLLNTNGYLLLIADPLTPFEIDRDLKEYKSYYCLLLCDGLYGKKIDVSERIWLKNYREMFYNMNVVDVE